MERLRVNFIGRVQGVGFRATARSIARSCTVSGWVRNEPDGSVMLEVQGDPAEVRRYIGLLRERMTGLIKSDHAVPVPVETGSSEFEIQR